MIRISVLFALTLLISGCITHKETGTEVTAYTVEGVRLDMVTIQGGSFIIGYDGSQPVHQVNIPSFRIGKYEVTQKLWRAVMGSNPNKLFFIGCDDCPVEGVSWNLAHRFIEKLNGITGRQFRLPSDSEWEFAARGGNQSHGYKYSGSNDLKKVGEYCGEKRICNLKTHPVGKFKPNELGLYDMSTNVMEWCEDYDVSHGYTPPDGKPEGPKENTDRLHRARGGFWGCRAPSGCEVTNRYGGDAEYSFYGRGLRLAEDL